MGFMRITGCLAAALAATTCATAVAAAQNGNGAPSGTHYSLNIIGVPRDKNSNPDWASGHVIFVNLGTKNVTVTTKILLSQSAEAGVFDVLDKNGTDGEASFSLPAPGSYTVWARALGTPGGQAKITTCATDILLTSPGVICSTQNEVFVRGTGKSSFRDCRNGPRISCGARKTRSPSGACWAASADALLHAGLERDRAGQHAGDVVAGRLLQMR